MEVTQDFLDFIVFYGPIIELDPTTRNTRNPTHF